MLPDRLHLGNPHPNHRLTTSSTTWRTSAETAGSRARAASRRSPTSTPKNSRFARPDPCTGAEPLAQPANRDARSGRLSDNLWAAAIQSG